MPEQVPHVDRYGARNGQTSFYTSDSNPDGLDHNAVRFTFRTGGGLACTTRL